MATPVAEDEIIDINEQIRELAIRDARFSAEPCLRSKYRENAFPQSSLR